MPVWLAILVILVAFYVMSAIVDGPFLHSLDRIASWMGLSSSVAGATLLAFGTSAPEISTALVALFAEGANPATGIGSIVGSAIFQILVVIGFAATVNETTLDWRPVLRDSVFYALAILLLIFVIHDGVLTVVEGGLLVGSYFVYLVTLWIWSRNVHEAAPAPAPAPPTVTDPPPSSTPRRALALVRWPVDLLLRIMPDPRARPRATIPVFVISLVAIGYACYWLVFAAEALALAMGVPPAIVALTILAGGSSVPELVSSASVARQGRGDMAVANAIGSNIFDIFVSLGLPVLIFCAMHGDLADLGGANIKSSVLLLFATLFAVVTVMAAQRFRIGRVFGGLLIVVYLAYIVAAYLGVL